MKPLKIVHTIRVASIEQIAYEQGGEALVIDTRDDRYFIEFGTAFVQADFLKTLYAAMLDRVARIRDIEELDALAEALR